MALVGFFSFFHLFSATILNVMKTRLRKNRDIYFIDVEGNLDLKGVDHLKSFCSKKQLKKKKVIFNLKSLFFVGSKGVDIFSETLDFVNKSNHLKICCASSEFEKVFHNEGLHSVLFPSEEEAIMSFVSNQNEYLLKHD